MKVRDSDPLDLMGSEGESITVLVQATKAKVDLMLNGQPFDPGTFVLNAALADPTRLSVAGVYTDTTQGGGMFSVELAGSGPDVATKTVTQSSSGEVRRSFAFSIDIA